MATGRRIVAVSALEALAQGRRRRSREPSWPPGWTPAGVTCSARSTVSPMLRSGRRPASGSGRTDRRRSRRDAETVERADLRRPVDLCRRRRGHLRGHDPRARAIRMDGLHADAAAGRHDRRGWPSPAPGAARRSIRPRVRPLYVRRPDAEIDRDRRRPERQGDAGRASRRLTS